MILANDEAASTANKQKCTYRDFILYILMNSIFRGTEEEEEERNNNLMDAEMGERVSLIKLNLNDMMDFFHMQSRQNLQHRTGH